jgi:hypothetical protein
MGEYIMSLAYRMDFRTKEQFEKDIKDCHRIEREIINIYIRQIEEEKGIKITVTDNGCDNSGKLIKNRRVTADADFLINGIPVEVKFNKKMLKYFHLKQNQLNSYIKQGANILWVNGWETDNPVYTIMHKNDLLDIKENLNPISIWVFGGKQGYRLLAKNYRWNTLIRNYS